MPRVSAGHQKRQRERIVVAAEACFAENGFHATSMDDVVNAVGMSTSTVYNYFPGGKNELIVTVCKERTDAVFARIAILAKRENPPSLREVYAEVALAFWRHMEKVERERLRSDEEDAPDEGEQAPEEGGQVLGEGGRPEARTSPTASTRTRLCGYSRSWAGPTAQSPRNGCCARCVWP